jgi:hypothetical protein
MINSKLIHTLRTFDQKELLRFHKMLHSPYFNKDKPVQDVFDELVKFHPHYTNKRLTFENLHEKIYPGKRYSLSTMKNIFADLLKLVQKFLIQKGFEDEKGGQYDCLLRQLTDRRLAGMFEMTLDSINSDYLSERGVDSLYFLDRYRFESDKYNFITSNDKILKNKELNNETGHLVRSFINLVNFFVMEMATVYLNLEAYASDYNTENIRNMIKKFMKSFDLEKIDGTFGDLNEYRFVFELYGKLLAAFEEFDDEQKYFDYKAAFNKYVHKLSADEISFHLSRMNAYCVMKNNRGGGKHDFRQELSEIYNTMLENKYYLDRKFNFMHYDLFRSILLHGISMKNLTWTRNFVKKYSNEVHPKMREGMREFGDAYVSFAAGNFEEALKHAGKIPQDYFIFKHDVKNLLLRIHTELGNYGTALDLIHSHKEVLRKDAMISNERRKRYLNFLRFLERLIMKKEGKEKIDFDYFFHKLGEEKNVSFKDWLTEKYETVLGKVKRTG